MIGGHGFTGVLSRALLCAAFLLPPTILMGATLPCAARFVENTPKGVSWLGILYTGNLAGAVFGCLLGGFYLLRLYDMATATFAAAAINAALAASAFLLASVAPYSRLPRPAPGRAPLRLRSWAVYLTIGLSGLTALGAQVVWTRLLSLLLGASVYTFSIVLAVFLLGLGLGSSAGSAAARSGRDPLALLGWCQALLIAAIAWAAFSIDAWLPYWPVDPRLSFNPWLTFQIDLARCLWAVLPAACLWGASFPLALAAAAPQREDSGRMVGPSMRRTRLARFVGAVAFSVILIPAAGTLWAQRILIAVAALAVAPAVLARLGDGTRAGGARMPRIAEISAGLAAAAAALALAYAVPPVPGELFAFGRTIMNPDYSNTMLYAGEGMNSSIAVSKGEDDSVRYFHVAGKIEASEQTGTTCGCSGCWATCPAVHSSPRSVLIVGCGAGVTAGSFVPYPEVERIVICEIEPLIPEGRGRFFSEENYDVWTTRGSRSSTTTPATYILTTQGEVRHHHLRPDPPLGQGLRGSLYSQGVLRAVQRHLNPGGMVTQWVPLYESTRDAVKSEMATFFDVFPEGTIWGNDSRARATTWSCSARTASWPIDLDAASERLGRRTRRAARRSAGWAFSASTASARSPAPLRTWRHGCRARPSTRDRNLRLQYLAGLGLNVYAQEQITSALLDARKDSARPVRGFAELRSCARRLKAAGPFTRPRRPTGHLPYRPRHSTRDRAADGLDRLGRYAAAGEPLVRSQGGGRRLRGAASPAA